MVARKLVQDDLEIVYDSREVLLLSEGFVKMPSKTMKTTMTMTLVIKYSCFVQGGGLLGGCNDQIWDQRVQRLKSMASFIACLLTS